MAEDIDHIEIWDHTDAQIVNPDSFGSEGVARVTWDDIAAQALASEEPHIINIDSWRRPGDEDPLPNPE